MACKYLSMCNMYLCLSRLK